MERLKELITILKDQVDSKTAASQMLETVRLLEAELQLAASQPAPARAMPTKITVMMPSASKIYAGGAGQPIPERQPVPEPRKDLAGQRNGSVMPQAPAGNNGQAPAPASTPVPAATTAIASPTSATTAIASPTSATAVATPATAAAIAATATAVAAPATATLQKPQDRGVWPFDPLAEKPTDRFTLSQKSREVNDVIGTSSTSLNDKLKSEVADLKSALNDTPVRDLRKAIGVNDRYVFINHLFRGDEVMYERSLKTINGFRILPEAEYWMERELKVKLGWDENNQTTRHFYQLVKRRFS